MPHRSGISNRESAEQEDRERQQHPPIETDSTEPDDSAELMSEPPADDLRDQQTSTKAGSRSIAQKTTGSRYPDRPMPASRKVAGAFGKEPKVTPDRE